MSTTGVGWVGDVLVLYTWNSHHVRAREGTKDWPRGRRSSWTKSHFWFLVSSHERRIWINAFNHPKKRWKLRLTTHIQVQWSMSFYTDRPRQPAKRLGGLTSLHIQTAKSLGGAGWKLHFLEILICKSGKGTQKDGISKKRIKSNTSTHPSPQSSRIQLLIAFSTFFTTKS